MSDTATRELNQFHVLTRADSGRWAKCLADIGNGLALWRLWVTLGWNDILQRYRRSILGPFWLTASMAVMVVALGFLYSELFRTPIRDFLPYLCVGLLVWNFLSSFLTEGCNLFIGSESYIKQIKLPFSVYVFRSSWSKLIVFAHNFVIYFGIILYFGIWPGAASLLFLPALALLILNGAAASTYLGMLSARFRDIPQLVASIVQIIFFMTPIMWNTELLKGRRIVADINPFYHLIEIARAPLLGVVPDMKHYVIVLAITVVNLGFALLFFVRFRNRVAYWV